MDAGASFPFFLPSPREGLERRRRQEVCETSYGQALRSACPERLRGVPPPCEGDGASRRSTAVKPRHARPDRCARTAWGTSTHVLRDRGPSLYSYRKKCQEFL